MVLSESSLQLLGFGSPSLNRTQILVPGVFAMAYFGKLGALTRQIVSRSMLQRTGAAVTVLPSVYLLQRGMASSKLFIGGLCLFLSFSFSIVIL